jgi:polar amino acid transport system substrate-binding protein
MKKVLALLLALVVLVVIGVAGCSSNSSKQSSSAAPGSIAAIKAAGTIRIGIFSDDAPFCYQDTDGTFKGYDVELGKEIAKELLGDENKVTWVTMTPADRIPYLQTGKVDLMLADFTVTADRAKSVDFTLPYEKVSIGVASSAKAPITSIDQLKGKTLVVSTGTTEDAYFATTYPNLNIIKEDAITDGFQALTTGRADAFSQDNTLLLSWVKKNPGYVVGIDGLGPKSYIAGAVKKGNTELLTYVNNLITGPLKDEQFFHKDYNDTLESSFPANITADQIVVEGGVTQ